MSMTDALRQALKTGAANPKYPVFLVYRECVYRPAGYRIPFPDELYVAKDGHIKRATHQDMCQGDRLIVRPFSPSDDFKVVNA